MRLEDDAAGSGHTGPLSAIPAERLAEASVWVARLHRGEHDPAVAEACQRWLNARPVNARAFELATEVWEESEQLRRVIPFGARDARVQRLPFRAWVAIAATLVAVATTLMLLFSSASRFSTGVGEQRSIALQDGTRVFLNTATRLVVRYDASVRRVELQGGEALFEVAKRKDWPFVVEAAGRQIRALGTSFVVRDDPEALAVTLVEGRVTVSSTLTAEESRLVPGQRLTFAAGEPPHLDTPTLEKVTAWRRGQVILDDTPLGAAIAEMNRYSAVKLVLEDQAVGSLRVSGLFQAGDSASFATALAQTYGLSITTHRNEIVVAGQAN